MKVCVILRVLCTMLTGFAGKFYRHMQTAFGKEAEITLSPALLPASPFIVLLSPEKKLAFHLISLNGDKLKDIPADFFSSFIDSAEKQGVQLINVWEDIWNTRQKAVIERLQALAGKQPTLFARKTTVQRIDKKTATGFLSAHHLLGAPNARYKYGLYLKDEMVAVATFSAPRTFYREGKLLRSYELIRYAGIGGYTITGGLSKLLKYFIEEVRPDEIMTYADRDWWTGKSYFPLGFKQVGNTQPQTFWIHPLEQVRYTENRLPAGILQEYSTTPGMPLSSFLEQKEYIRIYNSGNRKFLLTLV